MSKHTAGPWKRSGKYVVRGPDNKIIVVIRSNQQYRDDAEDQANTALIASALELLDALQRLLRANEADYELCPKMDVQTAFETNSMAIRQAREAIAKATQA